MSSSVTSIPVAAVHSPKLLLPEVLRLVYETFCDNKVRFLLATLGLAIGTASLILVVTVGLMGKEYVVSQIQSIGVNMIDAEYETGGEDTSPDRLTIEDMNAVVQQVFGIRAASPVVTLNSRIPSVSGQERNIQELGVLPAYSSVRNLAILSGRFFDERDEQARNKVGVIQEKLAEHLYDSAENAVGKVLRLNGLPFTIIGTFRERVDTFGESEVTDDTVLIPYSVARDFTDTPGVQQLYFSAADSSSVVAITEQVRRIIQSRHRPESNYDVQNLSGLVSLADHTANALSLVLFLISVVTLLVGGIGIMNIMLATVTSRIHEIGIRKAVGATKSHIRVQFLLEAVLICLIGGAVGVALGLAVPFSVRIFSNYHVPISWLSAVIAIVASAATGIIFGILPASRAAKKDPVESLRFE